MKKAKVLALILVLSLMITGVAYALWNENVKLSTTAAMGEMDLELTCAHEVYALSFMPGIDSIGPFTYGDFEPYMNPLTGTVSADKQTITVNVAELYPGAKYGLNYQIKNTGDVPFKLQGVTITCTDNWNLFSKLTGSFQFAYQRANGDRKLVTVPATALTADGLAAALVTACRDITLYPGDQLIGWAQDADDVTTFMQVSVDDKIAGDDYEKQHTAFTIDFNWQQCNPVVIGG
ncbi:MAG: hypothetical protein CVU91_05825 [Firmicutes bacterium HGW-Firmicutes-16]|nr:MAG: hypothetical protein CVU91_05825 [Firmicutes bacterium HGW-Firmicutes-16]